MNVFDFFFIVIFETLFEYFKLYDAIRLLFPRSKWNKKKNLRNELSNEIYDRNCKYDRIVNLWKTGSDV